MSCGSDNATVTMGYEGDTSDNVTMGYEGDTSDNATMGYEGDTSDNATMGYEGDTSDNATMGYEGDTCSFTCNTGYELTGSDARTCQSDGRWSGSDVCRRGNL